MNFEPDQEEDHGADRALRCAIFVFGLSFFARIIYLLFS